MRNTVILSGIFLFACTLITGCGGPSGKPEDLAPMILEVNEILVTIKDKKSAEEATPKLKAAGEKMKKQKEAMEKKYPQATDKSQQPTMAEADQKKLEDAIKKHIEEVTRVGGVDGGKEALKAYTEAAGEKEGGKGK